MNLADLNALFSIGQLDLGENTLGEILADDKQNKEQPFKDLFGKDYKTYLITIGTGAYDKPLRVAIGVPEKMSDLAGAKSCDSSSETDYDLFRAEMQMLEKVAPQLAEKYPDEFIAVQNGKVLDHDKDELALTKRVYSRYPHDFVLIRHIQQINIPTEVWLESPE